MNRQWFIYGGIGAGVMAVIVLYSLFAYAPLADKLAERKQVLASVTKQYNDEQALITRRDEFGERASKLRIEREKLNEQLPSTSRMPDLLKAITLAATECRLRNIKFTPMPLQEQNDVAVQRIQLSATCRYHNLGTFISKVAAMPRLVNTQVVEIKSNDKSGRGDSIMATLMLVTYVKKK